MYFLVYAIFIYELQKIFFLRDMMDNQCANIFCTHATVYGSHSVEFAFVERDNSFLYMYPQLNFVFKFGLCVFIFPTFLNFPQSYFSQNMFCFSYFYRGRKVFFLTFVVLRGSCCASQGELPLFFIELDSFVSLILYLLLTFVVYVFVYSLFEFSLSICDKKGEKQMKCGGNPV